MMSLAAANRSFSRTAFPRMTQLFGYYGETSDRIDIMDAFSYHQ